MTDEELAAVEARCRAATPGPWEYGCGSVTDWRADRSPEYTTEMLWNRHAGKAQRDADGAFIAHAREDVPALAAEVRRLRARPSLPDDPRDLLVYVAGPLTRGDLAANVAAACAAGMALMKAGLSPVVPHLSAYLGQDRAYDLGAVYPEAEPGGVPYEDWIAWSLAVVRRCGALVRLPGDSPGADREAAEARSRGIPVYPGVAELLADLPALTNRPAPGADTPGEENSR